jgi:two-component system LytT family response regulator
MKQPKTITVLIVDDEPLALHGLRDILTEDEYVTVLGEAKDGEEAVEQILRLTPDVVFLDIQMPEQNGFDVIGSLPKGKLPLIIFVTAYDEFAVKAFAENAIDYILKPFDAERIHRSLKRAREMKNLKEQASYSTRIMSALDAIHQKNKYLQKIPIRDGGKIYFLNCADILWIEADADYIRFHTAKKIHIARETMSGIEKQLDPEKFVRIHRSTIVNLDHVRELQPREHGEYTALLTDGSTVTVSRKYKEMLSFLL